MKERRPSTDYWVSPVFDDDGRQVQSAIGPDGKEYPDSVPLSPPVGFEAPDTLETIVARLMRSREFAAALDRAGIETPEEGDDFDVDDEDYDPRFPETIFEAYFEAKSRRQEQAAAKAEASRKASADLVSEEAPVKSEQTPKGEEALKVDTGKEGPVSRVSDKS